MVVTAALAYEGDSRLVSRGMPARKSCPAKIISPAPVTPIRPHFLRAIIGSAAWTWRPPLHRFSMPKDTIRQQLVLGWASARGSLGTSGFSFSWPERKSLASTETVAELRLNLKSRGRSIPSQPYGARAVLVPASAPKRKIAVPSKKSVTIVSASTPRKMRITMPTKMRILSASNDRLWQQVSFLLMIPTLILWWHAGHVMAGHAVHWPTLAETFDEMTSATTSEPAPASPAPPVVPNLYRQAAPDFMRAADYVCAVKPEQCERLLAIAKIESDLGRNTINQKSSARGAMQVLSGEFMRMVTQYGANNVPGIAGYIVRHPPGDPEAAQLHGNLVTLEDALIYMGSEAYRKNHVFPPSLQQNVLRLNDQPLIQMLFVADSLAERDAMMANRGLSPEDRFKYAYLAYAVGPPTAEAALAAYDDPARRGEPILPILTDLYARNNLENGASRRTAYKEAQQFATKVLVYNGQNATTTVEQFVDARVAPFTRLVYEYHQMRVGGTLEAER
jgi:hypothetical protein